MASSASTAALPPLDELRQALSGRPWTQALSEGPFRLLCESCLGRFLSDVARGRTNAERGGWLRQELRLPAPAAACPLCDGITSRYDDLLAVARAATGGWEHETFLFGTSMRPTDKRREEAVLAAARAAAAVLDGAPDGLTEAPVPKAGPSDAPSLDAAWDPLSRYEPLKMEVNREVGRRYGEATGKSVEFSGPDVTIILDPVFGACRLEVASIYIHGRYRKLERGIPQTRWPCRVCWGAGCGRCGGTGKTYPTSVEELAAEPFMEATGAAEHAFHGMGREDIDALMLGTGRPFILELKAPRRRHLDLAALEAEVNRRQAGRVEVEGLRLAAKKEVAALKEAATAKTYRAEVQAEAPCPGETLKKATLLLRQTPLAQRTPARVSHRRADLVRTRNVLRMEVEAHEGDRFRLLIEAESGTYIKELVSGDDGRTKPSLAELVGVPMKVTALDVIAVEERQGITGDEGEGE